MNYKLLLLLLLFPLSFQAQVKKVPATIVNPGSLYSTYDFELDAGKLKPAIKLHGANSLLSNIIKYSHQSNWPIGMQDLDARLASKSAIMNYKAYKIVSTSDYCILQIPASENKHMEAKMRPNQDIYFIMERVGASYEGNIVEPQVEIVEESYEDESSEDGILVTIVDPGDLYSTFDLDGNESIRQLLVESGSITEADFKIIVDRASEKGWPTGISTLTGRLAVKEKIKEYVAYHIADFGDQDEYVMIWIPQDENQHMPSSMRPKDSEGMFFIMKQEGIEF